MTIQLDAAAWQRIFPKARADYLSAFAAKGQRFLDAFGISHTRQRLSFFLANIHHECRGLEIIEENLHYSETRLRQVWPGRFDFGNPKYPNAVDPAPFAGNGRKLANKTYGGRMGNRPGTDDGWDYRGSGPCQLTGRDGYAAIGAILAMDLVGNPGRARDPLFGPEISCAFWDWKKMNAVADAGDFIACVKRWNGGTIGLADRQAQLARIRKIVDTLPGSPPTKEPPKEAIKDATANERRTIAGSGTATGATAATQATPQPIITSTMAWTCAGIFIVILIVGLYLYGRKKQAVIEGWK